MAKDRTNKEIEKIENQINRLYDKLLEKRPSHFRERDVVNAFFASLILGLVFLFKGSLIQISLMLKDGNLIAIIIATILILTLEIYFVGYTRISPKERETRHFGQFWLKRIMTLYLISIIASVFLVYLYGVNNIAGSSANILRVVIAVSMPCAIGAAIPSLLKQY